MNYGEFADFVRRRQSDPLLTIDMSIVKIIGHLQLHEAVDTYNCPLLLNGLGKMAKKISVDRYDTGPLAEASWYNFCVMNQNKDNINGPSVLQQVLHSLRADKTLEHLSLGW